MVPTPQFRKKVAIKRTRRSRAMRAAGLMLAFCIGAWGLWGLIFSAPHHILREAGSSAIVTPITPLRLVSAMIPASSADAREFTADEIIRYTDSEIQLAVAVKLEEMSLPVEPLEIRVHDRQVQLEGRVADVLLRDAIEITVRSVPGVRTVDNRLKVVNSEQ